MVTTVPSTSGRLDHPLRTMVAGVVGATRDRYCDLLTAAPRADLLGRAASAQRFVASPLSGEPVLLVDDTWTTGGHVQSAVAALKASGAGQVAAVVLGRHLNTTYGDTAALVDRARLRAFSWETCCVHQA
jgi:orotate phosphoribosyltransferase